MRPILICAVLALLAGCGSRDEHRDRAAAPAATPGPLAKPVTAAKPVAATATCLPRDGSLLARAPRFTLLSSEHSVSVCTRATHRRHRFSDDAIAVAAAAYGSYAAVTEDVCPGGFEGCWVGITVLRLPGRQVVSRFQFGTRVGRLAVGRRGALALLTCTPLDETAECLAGSRDEQVLYRLDGRGLKRLAAAGTQIDPRSLHALPGGRAFTWREGPRRKTVYWSGAPPARLR